MCIESLTVVKDVKLDIEVRNTLNSFHILELCYSSKALPYPSNTTTEYDDSWSRFKVTDIYFIKLIRFYLVKRTPFIPKVRGFFSLKSESNFIKNQAFSIQLNVKFYIFELWGWWNQGQCWQALLVPASGHLATPFGCKIWYPWCSLSFFAISKRLLCFGVKDERRPPVPCLVCCAIHFTSLEFWFWWDNV